MNATPPQDGPLTVERLIRRLGAGDATGGARPAWQEAGPLGAPAVAPLIGVMGGKDAELARAAKRALWSVVDHAGRPGADEDRERVVAELGLAMGRVGLSISVVRELLWMLGSVGDDRVVPSLAAKLVDRDLREDARCVLQRIPGEAALRALREALDRVPGDFAVAIADALRARGEVVDGRPSRRLVPDRSTGVGV